MGSILGGQWREAKLPVHVRVDDLLYAEYKRGIIIFLLELFGFRIIMKPLALKHRADVIPLPLWPEAKPIRKVSIF